MNPPSFSRFSIPINQKLHEILKSDKVFTVQVNFDELWELYLNSFPKELNSIFRERNHYDCNCCKHFIKNVGNIVYMNDNYQIDTIWNVEIDEPNFQNVANKLHDYIKDKIINGCFTVTEKFYSKNKTKDSKSDIIWEHFFTDNIPSKYVNRTNEIKSKSFENFSILKRSLESFSLQHVKEIYNILDNIYKGLEYKNKVEKFIKFFNDYNKINDPEIKNNFIWFNHDNYDLITFKNSVIGTLVENYQNSDDIEKSVKRYEFMVAPSNYKRPKPIITEKMIKEAIKEINKLGIRELLDRRFASEKDISINDIIYVDRNKLRLKDDLEEMLSSSVSNKIIKSNSFIDIEIEKFIKEVIPDSKEIEIYNQPKLEKNKMVLTTSKEEHNKSMFYWGNNVAWTYKNNFTDSSIKERVKNAGGNVGGYFRVSLSWFNTDDLDLHMILPDGKEIYYGNKCGLLDVDMNVSNPVRDAVENITFHSKSKIKDGIYTFSVNNFTKREDSDYGFEIELEIDNEIRKFKYDKMLKQKGNVTVFKINFKDGEIIDLQTVNRNIIEDNAITTSTNKISMICRSPNWWYDEKELKGNGHYFFIVDGMKFEEGVRGFFNEYIKSEYLNKIKKPLEILGNKMLIEDNGENQLCGFGFSRTIENEIKLKVKTEKTVRNYNVKIKG